MSRVIAMPRHAAVTDNYRAEPEVTTDYVLLVCVIALLSMGVVMVASASISLADKQLSDPFYYMRRQLIYVAMGLFLMTVVQHIRVVHWEKSGMALLIFSFFLLLIVLLPGIGHRVNGATRWLNLGVMTVQVSEPARLFVMVYLAGYLVRRGNEVRETMKGFLKPMFMIGIAAFLILLEPDFGSVVVMMCTALGMMFIAGVRFSQFAVLLSGMAGVFALLVFSSAYRYTRLTAFLDPWADPFKSGFQLTQSLIAFGSGGWTGLGLGGSVQKLFYLPEAHNDFLFAILAEELGIIGVLMIILLYTLLVVRGFAISRMAERQGNRFGALLSFGLALWFAIQAMINIGVNMGVLPTKGLTLPLMSAGGSSLLVMCVAAGLLLRIHKEVCITGLQAVAKSKRIQTSSKRGRGARS